MKFRISLLLFFILLNAGKSYSQVTLRGIVENENNNTPIPYAMIFLSNTSIGTLSDSLGHFNLTLNEGKHELIIKSLGFTTLNFELEQSEIQNRLYRFKLATDDLELTEVEVVSKRDQLWYGNLEVFKGFFLGNSTNSLKSKLVNPNILILDDQSIPRTLLAKANQDLIIENPNLGYTIRYLLHTFEYSLAEKKIFYGGYSYFTEYDGLSKRKKKQIETNRKKAYEGSSMHLLRAIYNNKVEEEGFLVRRLRKIPNINRPSEEHLDSIAQNIRLGRPTPYTIEEFARLKKLPKTIDQLEKNPIDLYQYITKEDAGKITLHFEDYLQVIYTKAKPDANYILPYKAENQESLIHFLNGKIEIYENGSFSPPYDLLFEGYMGWLKTGDLLPLDYKPL
ncbi:hypothetical protein Belba_2560 [Belliella baltica DSM 15883]|uniref:Carboxypeptidase-like regulatory domain-containing protein n=1 Tax=Belliella baltica (strain DSM 15883 / CIP 108006 / LMG 21964 / BA134) TaxID=866536 RepID=I3Z794_BELBD|nr:carboxypeptidase-like regulatory domain-containing protein [Belliella baltica]AFL85112.1 hypothetical protein Belba_2560 [Belliella baltica DSM 15883]